MYELLKFVLRSMARLHSKTFLNEPFVFDKPSYMNRRSTFNLTKIPNLLNKIQRTSISYRGAKLFNILKKIPYFEKNFDQVSNSDLQRIAHEIRDAYIKQ